MSNDGLPDEYLDYGKSIFIPHSHYRFIESFHGFIRNDCNIFPDEFKDKEVL